MYTAYLKADEDAVVLIRTRDQKPALKFQEKPALTLFEALRGKALSRKSLTERLLAASCPDSHAAEAVIEDLTQKGVLVESIGPLSPAEADLSVNLGLPPKYVREKLATGQVKLHTFGLDRVVVEPLLDAYEISWTRADTPALHLALTSDYHNPLLRKWAAETPGPVLFAKPVLGTPMIGPYAPESWSHVAARLYEHDDWAQFGRVAQKLTNTDQHLHRGALQVLGRLVQIQLVSGNLPHLKGHIARFDSNTQPLSYHAIPCN